VGIVKRSSFIVILLALGAALTGCDARPASASSEGQDPRGVVIDGSSTVNLIVQSIAEAYLETTPDAKLSVHESGTGGGFRKFCAGETHINGASRPIDEAELLACKQKGIEFIELPIAYDGIVVAVPFGNSWATQLTVAELKKLWSPEAQGKITRWRQLREYFPDEEIVLYGPGADSGTYDYFTDVVVGHTHDSRKDYSSSEDDEVLVRGVAENVNALGYFGYAYYARNKHRLKALAIDDGNPDNGLGAIKPSSASISDGSYAPFARTLFLYVSKEAARQKNVDAVMRFFLDGARAPKLVIDAGYVALRPRVYELARSRYVERIAGSAFATASRRDPIELVLTR
jgi:phosphate transport system substrate-binding protein